MDAKKVEEVIERYRAKFKELGVEKEVCPHDDLPERELEHCHAMLDQMEGLIRDGRMQKAFRWLGFVQGVLWSNRIYTLGELKDHNFRSDHV